MNLLILLIFAALMVRVIRGDTALRDGISGAVWIPTLWVGIISSRPVSSWFGVGGDSTLEGSPVDALIFLALIIAALVVVSKRGISVSQFVSKNWPIALFYLFLLVSVLWSHAPTSSIKRWIKEAGNVVVPLVILTEVNPLQAFRAVFVRCGYVLIPLSLILLRYFPLIGRTYNIHSGGMEATGVTFQKNSLGSMILVCGLIIFWDLLEINRSRPEQTKTQKRNAILGRTLVLLIGFHLLKICDSKTSMVCLVLGAGVLVASHVRVLKDKIRIFGMVGLAGLAMFMTLDQFFGIKDAVLSNLGRDATLTGRTEVWGVLLNLDINPLVGTGFMSFWDDASYRMQLPYWVAYSAHNGYIETYMAGGFTGLFFLAIMILGAGYRCNKALLANTSFAFISFAAFLVAVLANISESNFACMTPVGFLFLLTAIEVPPSTWGSLTGVNPSMDGTIYQDDPAADPPAGVFYHVLATPPTLVTLARPSPSFC